MTGFVYTGIGSDLGCDWVCHRILLPPLGSPSLYCIYFFEVHRVPLPVM